MNLAPADSALDKWQRTSETHFEALSAERRPAGLSVFAIEHGLDATALDAIAAGLRRRLVLWEPLGKHWLLWVIYAAEIGYDYDGEEYWPSFEKRTPNWSADYDRRRQLRQWFLKFHKAYAGTHPTGPWASQFSIIAWPITHAILPKDLQTQLAQVLYEQRYFVADFIEATPFQVGHLIAASAYGCSSRLSNFLEQEELAGRIVLALLGAHDAGAAAPVLDSALRRIVSDLEAARDARDWLQEARSAVAGAKVRLAAKRNLHSRSPEVNDRPGADAEWVEGRGIKPRLALIRDGINSWTATIELPSFSGLAALNAQTATFLRATRCKVAGAGSSWNPKGWLLYGTQRRRLLSWPKPARPVVTFEEWDAALFHVLAAECRITNGPIWLFRIARDGTAAEVIGRQVRPGFAYILLHTKALERSPLLQSSNVSCEGVMASSLNLPAQGAETTAQEVLRIGLKLERTIRVWPVGLPPAHWDGEGQMEWFSQDCLCIGLSHDSPCDGITLHLDGRKEGEVTSVAANQPTFLNLGQLAVGSHSLSVSAVYRSQANEKVQSSRASMHLSILVRPPHRWVPGTSGHAGLVVTTDPYEPTLDGLLSGHVRVSVVGPEGRAVTFTLELLSAGGSVLASEALGTLALPMMSLDWDRLLAARSERERDPSSYMRASGGRLLVESAGLGVAKVPLAHVSVPIRWLAQGTKRIELTLVNDTGHEDPVELSFATFRTPTTPNSLQVPSLPGCLQPTGRGGLYIAVAGLHRAGIVVSAPSTGGLQDLADRPELAFALNNGADVESLLVWLRDWVDARIVGPLASQRRSLALQGMEDQLFATMCWSEWIESERFFRAEGSSNPRAQERLENSVDRHASFAVGLSRGRDDVLTDSIDASARSLLGHALRYRVCGDQALCEAALRLTAIPERFAEWAGSRTVRHLDALVQLPVLTRGARMVALLMGVEGKRRARGWRT